MPKNTSHEIEQALADVRRSYRTLYTYQRMVLDVARYVGQRLSLEYIGGWPKYSDVSPRNGGGSLDRWAWDWLNMYFYEFHFRMPLSKEKELRVSMSIVSDTGYWESQTETVDRRDVESFAPVAQSHTKLLLMASPREAWDPNPLINDKAWMKTLFESPKAIVTPRERGNVITRAYDLHQFANAGLADARLREFIADCNKRDVPLRERSSEL